MTLLETLFTPLGWLLRGNRAGEDRSLRRVPELGAPDSITLASSAYPEGGTIPARHCHLPGQPNLSPDLRWTGVPDETRALLLVLEDFDIPGGDPSMHLGAILPTETRSLAEGALTADNPDVPYIANPRGRRGYSGPRPFPGHGPHRYGFTLFALDREISIPEDGGDPGFIREQAAGHVLARGLLDGSRTA